jgi:Na+/phosphate symporter
MRVQRDCSRPKRRSFADERPLATTAHFERLRGGGIETAETSSLHLDALRDLKLVNAHLVAAACIPRAGRRRRTVAEPPAPGRLM